MRLLRPNLRCPECHRPARLRVEAAERDAHAGDTPDRVLGTLQCHACDHIYPIKAAAYQMAS